MNTQTKKKLFDNVVGEVLQLKEMSNNDNNKETCYKKGIPVKKFNWDNLKDIVAS